MPPPRPRRGIGPGRIEEALFRRPGAISELPPQTAGRVGDEGRAREYIRGAITVLAECEDEWAKSRSQETLNKVEATIANRPAKA